MKDSVLSGGRHRAVQPERLFVFLSLNMNDIQETCQKNTAAALAVGRRDLAKVSVPPSPRRFSGSHSLNLSSLHPDHKLLLVLWSSVGPQPSPCLCCVGLGFGVRRHQSGPESRF